VDVRIGTFSTGCQSLQYAARRLLKHDDPPPPKISGSVAKSDLYATLALNAAKQLDRAAAQLELDGGLEAGARVAEYRLVAGEARELASGFKTWGVMDPGVDQRIRATARLMDVRAFADGSKRGPRPG